MGTMMAAKQTNRAGATAVQSSSSGMRTNEIPPPQRYQQARAALAIQAPVIAAALPEQWPADVPTLPNATTISAMREATSTLNEGLVLIGLGDGSALTLLRGDPNGRAKLVQVLVFLPEIPHFAHLLGLVDLSTLFNELHLGVHLVRSEDDIGLTVSRAFASHAQIARLAGTRVIDRHALVPAADELRRQWLPRINKLLLERMDCLGNDVYDTFMGAKHALMHGAKLMRYRRSSDYVGRYRDQTAICIASGPSVRKHYDRLRELQHEHVLICADSILAGLLAHGIEPDFVCMVERPDNMHRLIDDYAPKCKTVMVALPVVHPTSVTPFDDRVVWWWNADDLYPWIDPAEPRLVSGRSAGTITLAFAGLLGVKTAWLVGHDLAFGDGKSHDPEVAPLALEAQAEWDRELSRNNPNYYLRLIDTPQNGGGTVSTMGLWEIFRTDIEGIINSYQGLTRFLNVNIEDGVGAVIAGTQSGRLPEPTGVALSKSHPAHRNASEQWQAYRGKCLRLRDDFSSVRTRFADLERELSTWRPLGHTRAQVEEMGKKLDLGTIVSSENAAWFTFVFRAALRNLMVRLHHNTYVRTMAERNWNQVQVIRLYLQSIPALLQRLQPELEQALEGFSHE